MSMAKRWLETLPEFDEVVEVEPELAVLTVWRITSDEDFDALLDFDGAEDDDETGIYDDEPAIEDDYTWIRTGC